MCSLGYLLAVEKGRVGIPKGMLFLLSTDVNVNVIKRLVARFVWVVVKELSPYILQRQVPSCKKEEGNFLCGIHCCCEKPD